VVEETEDRLLFVMSGEPAGLRDHDYKSLWGWVDKSLWGSVDDSFLVRQAGCKHVSISQTHDTANSCSTRDCSVNGLAGSACRSGRVPTNQDLPRFRSENGGWQHLEAVAVPGTRAKTSAPQRQLPAMLPGADDWG